MPSCPAGAAAVIRMVWAVEEETYSPASLPWPLLSSAASRAPSVVWMCKEGQEVIRRCC